MSGTGKSSDIANGASEAPVVTSRGRRVKPPAGFSGPSQGYYAHLNSFLETQEQSSNLDQTSTPLSNPVGPAQALAESTSSSTIKPHEPLQTQMPGLATALTQQIKPYHHITSQQNQLPFEAPITTAPPVDTPDRLSAEAGNAPFPRNLPSDLSLKSLPDMKDLGEMATGTESTEVAFRETGLCFESHFENYLFAQPLLYRISSLKLTRSPRKDLRSSEDIHGAINELHEHELISLTKRYTEIALPTLNQSLLDFNDTQRRLDVEKHRTAKELKIHRAVHELLGKGKGKAKVLSQVLRRKVRIEDKIDKARKDMETLLNSTMEEIVPPSYMAPSLNSLIKALLDVADTDDPFLRVPEGSSQMISCLVLAQVVERDSRDATRIRIAPYRS
ncbi:hypothetical protein BC829DRAFT_447780 [Chytridium lagenaria]|nr:hypothetical protein BC829DRAFT_447780 [Chytridium lagenaria]